MLTCIYNTLEPMQNLVLTLHVTLLISHIIQYLWEGFHRMNYYAFDVKMQKSIFWYAVDSSFHNQSSCNMAENNEGK